MVACRKQRFLVALPQPLEAGVGRLLPGTSFVIFKEIATMFTLNTKLVFLFCLVWFKLYQVGWLYRLLCHLIA